jgi:hypothetical protein
MTYTTSYRKLTQLKGNRHKYGAIKTHGFDSKKEYHYACELEILKKGKAIKDYEVHKRFELQGINGSKVCRYIADFVVYHLDDQIEIIDVKSPATVTPLFRLKWKLLEDKYQDEIRKGLVKLTIQY